MLVSRKTLVFMLPSGRLVLWNLTVGNLRSITLQTFMSSTLTFRTPPFYPFLLAGTSEVSSAPRKHSAHMCSLWLDVHATRPAYQLKHCSWSSPWTAGWRTGWILGTALFTTTLGKYQLGGNLISRNSILITTGGKRDKSHLIFFTKF